MGLKLFNGSNTVKLSKFKRLPNRNELNTSSSRRTALEIFNYFVFFFVKSSVRFDRTKLQNELNMMHSSDEDIKLCSVDRFGSIELNRTFLQKNTKIIKKFGKFRVRFAVTKSN
jgi:hypothetical protein